jgi:hypothetical protein
MWKAFIERASMADWTVAVDDLLTQRLCCCTVCGRRLTRYWGVWEECGLLVGYMLCDRCHVTDKTQHSLRAVMQQRYKNEGR